MKKIIVTFLACCIACGLVWVAGASGEEDDEVSVPPPPRRPVNEEEIGELISREVRTYTEGEWFFVETSEVYTMNRISPRGDTK